jgi:hypothetical protein
VLAFALLWAVLSIIFIVLFAIVPGVKFLLLKGLGNPKAFQLVLAILLNIFKVFIFSAFLHEFTNVALVFLAFLAYVAGVTELVGAIVFEGGGDGVDMLLFFTSVGVLLQSALLLSDVWYNRASRALKHQSAAVEPLTLKVVKSDTTAEPYKQMA